MRAELVDLWPALSEIYGLMPWHLRDGLISPAELKRYLFDLSERGGR